MRILYITDALAVWGGIERVLCDKMNYLVKHGLEVYLITTDQGRHVIPYSLDERIQILNLDICFHRQYKYHGVKRLKKFLEYKNLFRNNLKSSIESIRPDVISCVRDGSVASVLKVRGNIPVIFESHAMCKDIYFEKSTRLHLVMSHLRRLRFKNLDRIVTLTKGDADDWKVYCEKISIIPNVVHLNRSGTYSGCTAKRVIFAGRFDLQKNIGKLLEIWELVQIRHKDWTLELFGNGELKPLFEHRVKERNLNVLIHPAVSNIQEKFIQSSILVMPSLYEPFGLVMPEAMSCGLPVVAFNCPYGPADIVDDGVNGFLVEDQNIDAFAEKLCLLIEDETLRKQMGIAARTSVLHYDESYIMPLWIKLFEELCRERT